MYRKIFFKALSQAKEGCLVINDGKDSRIIGETQKDAAELNVLDDRFFSTAVLYGDIGFGEAYMDGYWDSPDAQKVIDWFGKNARSLPTFAGSAFQTLLVNALGFINRVGYLLRPNSRKISRKNISDHYDLSNEFFSLMLDPTMAYSCASFQNPDDDLFGAQLRKFEIIASKLQLGEENHLLEIGSGWGGFAVFAAKNYGCRVTTVTISKEQYEFASDLIAREGLQNRIDLQLRDYRDIEGTYDRIVSIEMVEALGIQYLDVFFEKCGKLLEEDGIMLIQCITFPDPWYERYLKSNDFTQKYIFPGSLLLSLRETLNSLHRTGDLTVFHRKVSDWIMPERCSAGEKIFCPILTV